MNIKNFDFSFYKKNFDINIGLISYKDVNDLDTSKDHNIDTFYLVDCNDFDSFIGFLQSYLFRDKILFYLEYNDRLGDQLLAIKKMRNDKKDCIIIDGMEIYSEIRFIKHVQLFFDQYLFNYINRELGYVILIPK